MRVSVETTGGPLGRRLIIELPMSTFQERENVELEKLRKTMKVPGFRPGKANLDIVRRHAKDLQNTVIYELMREHFPLALKQLREDPTQPELRLASPPYYEMPNMEDAELLKLSYLFEVFPDIEAKPLDGVEITRVTSTVNESDIDETIERLRKQFANWQVVQGPAKTGDRAEIDFEGRIDGVAFEGGAAKKFSLELGSKRMIPGFEDGIIGMMTGDEKTIDVTFPADYPEATFAGKNAQFVIHLHKIEEPVLLDVETDLVKMLGVKEGSLESLRKELRQGMERELDANLRNRLKEEVFAKWLELNPIELPLAVISAEVDEMLKHMKDRFPPNADKQMLRTIMEPEAKKRVALALLMHDMVKQHNLKADPTRVQELITLAASAYENPEEMIKQYASTPHIVEGVESTSVEEQVIEKLLSTAKVVDEVWSFNEVMQGRRS